MSASLDDEKSAEQLTPSRNLMTLSPKRTIVLIIQFEKVFSLSFFMEFQAETVDVGSNLW